MKKVAKQEYINKWTEYRATEHNPIYVSGVSVSFYINKALRLCRLRCFTNESNSNIDGTWICTIPNEVLEIVGNNTIHLYSGVSAVSDGTTKGIFFRITNKKLETVTLIGNFKTYHTEADIMFNY